MDFPIINHENNALVNKHGETIYFFKFIPLDFEQVDEQDLLGYFGILKTHLQSLSHKDYFRIYNIKGITYLATNQKNISFPSITLEPLEDPLSTIIPCKGLYSDIIVGDDYVNYNNRYYKYIHLKDYPNEIYENHLADLGYDFVLNFMKLSGAEQTILLEYQGKNYEGKLASSKSKIESNKAQNALGTMEDMASKISRGIKLVDFFWGRFGIFY